MARIGGLRASGSAGCMYLLTMFSSSRRAPLFQTRPDTVNEAMFLRLAPSSALAGCFSASLSTKFQRQALSWDERRGSLHAIGQDNLLAIHELLRALVLRALRGVHCQCEYTSVHIFKVAFSTGLNDAVRDRSNDGGDAPCTIPVHTSRPRR